VWVPHDVRERVVDFVRYWSEKTEIGAGRWNLAGRGENKMVVHIILPSR
jgi:hypothetical protein